MSCIKIKKIAGYVEWSTENAVSFNRNNVFKVVELSAGYKHLTTPRKQTLPKDAVNEILR